jgi:hypothetical protein
MNIQSHNNGSRPAPAGGPESPRGPFPQRFAFFSMNSMILCFIASFVFRHYFPEGLALSELDWVPNIRWWMLIPVGGIFFGACIAALGRDLCTRLTLPLISFTRKSVVLALLGLPLIPAINYLFEDTLRQRQIELHLWMIPFYSFAIAFFLTFIYGYIDRFGAKAGKKISDKIMKR